MSELRLIDLIVPLRDEIEGFIALVDEEFLSMYREHSVFDAILLHDEALEREKQEAEPLKKAYLRAVAKVFKFIPMSSELPEGSIFEEFVKGLSGMEYEEYSKLADRRFERMLKAWEKGEIVVKEGERLRLDDEILETARYLVNVGVFSKYLQILELRRQMDELRMVLVGEWFEVLMDVWRMQKDAEEPLLVSALYIYLKPIVEKAEFVKDYLEKFYRRQLRQYGETPFLNACGIGQKQKI
jgi:hypothetical protein